MKRVLRDGLYRDERPEAGAFTIFLMYLMSFLIGAAIAFFIFLYICSHKVAPSTSHRRTLMQMDMGEAKPVLMGVALLGGGIGMAALFGWRRQCKEEMRETPPPPRTEPLKDFFDRMK